jgi:hypothetical protein
MLVESEVPQTAAQLAEKTGADPVFLGKDPFWLKIITFS